MFYSSLSCLCHFSPILSLNSPSLSLTSLSIISQLSVTSLWIILQIYLILCRVFLVLPECFLNSISILLHSMSVLSHSQSILSQFSIRSLSLSYFNYPSILYQFSFSSFSVSLILSVILTQFSLIFIQFHFNPLSILSQFFLILSIRSHSLPILF